MDEALAGTLSPERLSELLPAAAGAFAVNEYAKTLAGNVERVLLGEWHRAVEAGGADSVLDSMRPQFDRHAKAVAKARSMFSAESTAESVLSSAPSEVVGMWQGLGDHLAVIARIALVAREFGPRLGDFPMIREFTGGDGHTLADEAIMVADGGLQAGSAHFMRPDRGHKDSPLFKVQLRLHSITSARERYRMWAADQWDGINSGRDRGGWIDQQTGEVHPHPALVNPYRQQEVSAS